MQPTPRRLSGWKLFVISLWLIGSFLTFAFPNSSYVKEGKGSSTVWQGYHAVWDSKIPVETLDRKLSFAWVDRNDTAPKNRSRRFVNITFALFQELALTALCGALFLVPPFPMPGFLKTRTARRIIRWCFIIGLSFVVPLLLLLFAATVWEATKDEPSGVAAARRTGASESGFARTIVFDTTDGEKLRWDFPNNFSEDQIDFAIELQRARLAEGGVDVTNIPPLERPNIFHEALRAIPTVLSDAVDHIRLRNAKN